MAYYQNPLDATTLPAWQALSEHRDAMQNFTLRQAFAGNHRGRSRYGVSLNGRCFTHKPLPSL